MTVKGDFETALQRTQLDSDANLTTGRGLPEVTAEKGLTQLELTRYNRTVMNIGQYRSNPYRLSKISDIKLAF